MYWESKITILSLALLTFIPINAANAEGKSASWVDVNYVPCEGMGATASGRINVNVGFTSQGNAVKVTALEITSTYLHPHQSSARVTYERPSSGTAGLNLQEPWFATIGPNDGSKTLLLPRSGSGSGPAAQTSFDMKAGTRVKIDLTARFPQHGGNCFSSFSNELALP
jgi:hypothetical protein